MTYGLKKQEICFKTFEERKHNIENVGGIGWWKMGWEIRIGQRNEWTVSKAQVRNNCQTHGRLIPLIFTYKYVWFDLSWVSWGRKEKEVYIFLPLGPLAFASVHPWVILL